MPGVRECAIPFATLADAERAKQALMLAEGRSSRVRALVVGGGFSGVELSASLRARLVRVAPKALPLAVWPARTRLPRRLSTVICEHPTALALVVRGLRAQA